MKQYFDYLMDLYNGVHYIKNSSNEDIYDILESTYVQRNALLQISKYGAIDRNTIFTLDDLTTSIPFMESCKESPILDSVNKLRIIFSIIGDSLGFSFSDFELITGSIIIKNHGYNNYTRNIRTKFKSFFNNKTPFFSLTEIRNITNLKMDVINNYMKIFSEKINCINLDNIYKVIQTECGYIQIFSEKFYYYAFTYLEQYIINNKLIDVEDYYNKRGKYFELYVEEMFESFFDNCKIYKNLIYRDGKKKMEIDLLIDFGDCYLIVEDKSTIHLDKKEVKSEEDFKKLTVNAYKRGMRSLDNAYNYMNRDEIIAFDTLKLNRKRVYSIIISLRKNYFASGEIQKIFSEQNCSHLSPLYHVSDLADILLIINLSKKINLKKGFFDYLDKRCEIINEYENFTADIDEIDLFGMITTPDYFERVKPYMDISKSENIDFTFMDSEGYYRKVANDELNNRYLSHLIDNYFKFLI